MKAWANRVSLPVTAMAMVFAIVLPMSPMQSAPTLALDGSLTNCKVTGVISGGPAPNPAFQAEQVVTNLTADFDQPKANAECQITGPKWTWTILSVERRAQSSTTWIADQYRPNLQQLNTIFPDAKLTASFPKPGEWRVNLQVMAEWDSPNCIGCSPTANLSVGYTISACSFAGMLTPADNFEGRSLSSIGLAEPGTLAARAAPGVDLTTLQPFLWRVISGSTSISVDGNADGSGTFTATRIPGRAVLELSTSKVNCRATLTVDVVPPNDIYHIYFRDGRPSGFAGGKLAYTMDDYVYLRPTNVSFNWLTIGEDTATPKMTGVFLDIYGPSKFPPIGMMHTKNGPVAMGPGNLVLGSCAGQVDQISVAGVPVDSAAGYFEWDIPQQYFDDGGYRITIRKLLQRSEFDGARTVVNTKGGAQHSGPQLP